MWWDRRWGGPLAGMLLCACGYFSSWVTEHRNASVPHERFRTIALLLGTADPSSAALAGQIERRLADSGWTLVPRPGRWRTEVEAVHEICGGGPTASPDGVLFVWLDRLKLWDCATRAAAYEILSERAGQDELVNRFVRYLRGAAAAVDSASYDAAGRRNASTPMYLFVAPGHPPHPACPRAAIAWSVSSA